MTKQQLRRRSASLIFFAVMVAMVGVGLRGYTTHAAPRAVQPVAHSTVYELIPSGARVAAPDFTLTDIQGRTIKLSGYRGKVVLLDFWATTCGGCKIEIPWYVEFDRKYRDQGLALIGIDMYGESVGTIKPFMEKWHMDYPVAIGSDAIGHRFGVTEMPLTLLIDREGRIAVSHAGIVDKAQFEKDIRDLLQ